MEKTLHTTHSPKVTAFFDRNTNTISYVVVDDATKKCAVIDSVADYEPNSGTLTYGSTDLLINYIIENGYSLEWILETHVHADHLTGAAYLKKKLGGKIAMSKAIIVVQGLFGDAFGEGENFLRDGSQFDVLFEEDEKFMVGSIPSVALSVPGHTPADVAYYVGDALFVGDTLFMPDYGSARCDFPGGSATKLYESVQKLFALPRTTRTFMCHDYLPEGRNEFRWETTVEEELEKNIHLAAKISQEEFIRLREGRDATLVMPKLIIPALQVNLRAGNLPDEVSGKVFLKVPLNGIFSKK